MSQILTFIFAKFDNDTIIALGTQKDEYDYESKHLLPNESLEKVDSINGFLTNKVRSMNDKNLIYQFKMVDGVNKGDSKKELSLKMEI